MATLDRRSFLSLAALGGISLGLAGCATTSGGGPASGRYTTAAKSLKATITYGIWDANQQPAMRQIISEFNEVYPDITVNISLIPNAGDVYWTKLTTLAQGGNLPDVFWMNGPHIRLYALNDQLMSLEPMVAAGAITKSDYPSAMTDLYSVDGTLYGAPKDFDTIGLYYNKGLLQQAGVSEPTNSWTWDDLTRAGKQVADHFSGKGVFGFSGDITSGQSSWYNTVLQAGGSIISADGKKSGYDSPATITGLQFWTDLIGAGTSPSVEQLTTTAAGDWFTSGKLAMVTAGDWKTSPFTEALGGELGLVRLPKGPVNNHSVIHGLGNVIPKNAKHPEASMAFVAFLAGKQAADIQARTGLVIPAFSASQSTYAASQKNVDLNLFLEEAKTASPYPISKNTSAWNQLESDLLPAAFAGKRPVKQVAKELAARMNAELAKG